MFPIEKRSLNSHHGLFVLVILAVCTVTVRNIEADSAEPWLVSAPFSTIEADTFIALTAQSLKHKDKRTVDQRCMY